MFGYFLLVISILAAFPSFCLSNAIGLVCHEISHAEIALAWQQPVFGLVIFAPRPRKLGLGRAAGLRFSRTGNDNTYRFRRLRPYPILVGLPSRGRVKLRLKDMPRWARLITAAAGPIAGLLATLGFVLVLQIGILPELRPFSVSAYLATGVTIGAWMALWVSVADFAYAPGSDTWHIWEALRNRPYPSVPVRTLPPYIRYPLSAAVLHGALVAAVLTVGQLTPGFWGQLRYLPHVQF